MRAEAGDHRVTDPSTGHQWSITDTALRAGYQSLGNGVYMSGGAVRARQVGVGDAPVHVETIEGPEVADQGDWIITDSGGRRWVVGNDWFRDHYRSDDRHEAGVDHA